MALARALSACLALALAASAQAAMVCVDPDPNDSCADTIQAGVNAAVAGDVVQVAPGLYLEEVAIATAGITLRGGKGALIDPSGLPPPAHAIHVTAADVVIDGIGVRNGDDDGIRVTGVPRTQIRRVDVQSPDDVCVNLMGTTPDTVIEGSRFRDCGDEAVSAADADRLQLLGNNVEGGDGFDVIGDEVHAERNGFLRYAGTGLGIEGSAAMVTGNRFERGDGGIGVEGGQASITRNSLTNLDGTAIDVEGDDPLIEGNPISSVGGTGISLLCEVACNAARIVRNRLAQIGGTGISAETLVAGLVVEGNQVSQATGTGIDLDTVGARAESNRVTGAGTGSGDCMNVEGSDNSVLGNALGTCSADGIFLEGDDNSVEGNRVSNTSDDAIDVDDGAGNDVLENRAGGAIDNGIEVSAAATTTTVSDNQASGLRADYCDSGTATGGTDVPDVTLGCGDIDD
jgi:parallel beta-helix repeat protein